MLDRSLVFSYNLRKGVAMLSPDARHRIHTVVAQSADVMDDLRPGWYDLIDLDTLDIDDICSCVATQVYGDYASASWDLESAYKRRFGDDGTFGGWSTVIGSADAPDAECGRETTASWREQVILRRRLDDDLRVLVGARSLVTA